ncbi:glycoside hydrolase family 3 N-terminal domain-containing protein [Prochlorococcus marinus]|uniref:glycoside hydrolase family 3 N-terminal domain-containing protein n=1 Tax=Prochlorococcus TaxID=1218 RepID=UPI0007B36A53|nr:glycoside hydrolase family 3 N-terminal domain-containing protein [Prochlorococcus marinus]KZR74406.1 putative lipoprotein YbbD precursor [Prochlorococcus marinus str. MIT 1323]
MNPPIQSPLRRQVAELLVVRASGHASDDQRRYPKWELSNAELKRLLAEGVGGVILLGGTSTEIRHRCKRLRQWAKAPLLLCADVEEGVGQRFEGGTWLVPPMALGRLYQEDQGRAVNLAERYGRCTGHQARRCGLNWVLAPVCDVNNNPANPVINVRAWGEDTAAASSLACAFQQGLAAEGVLGCAKHFPGHGNTGMDSHLQLPVLDDNLRQLVELELVPFQAVMKAGIDSIMTAHLLMRNLDASCPATLSPAILQDLLRRQLKFEGLVVTDALVMRAITQSYSAGEAAVMAFAAGADLILMPENADDAIEALCKALQSGQIPMQRLHASQERRRKALQKVGTSTAKLALKDSTSIDKPLERDEDRALARELVTASLKIHNPGPVTPTESGINLLRVDGVLPCSVLTATAPALVLPSEAGFQSLLCHPLGISPWQDDPDQPLALERLGIGPVMLQLFLRGNPFRGDQDRHEPWVATVKQLQQQKRLAGLVVYGSPYIWDELIEVLNIGIPAAYSPGQMPEAQRQVLTCLLQPAQVQSSTQTPLFQDFTD